jgi:TctA family transporter
LIFVARPISAVALGFASLLLLTTLIPHFKKRRQQYDEFKE